MTLGFYLLNVIKSIQLFSYFRKREGEGRMTDFFVPKDILNAILTVDCL